MGSGAPAITVQPFSRTLYVGDTATLTAMAVGVQPLSYQWKSNGVDILGATTNSYTFSNVRFENAGEYSVLVANALGSVLSSNATLMVEGLARPVVGIAYPSNQTCQLSFGTQPGKVYWIQSSTNLANWTARHASTGTGGVFQFTDANLDPSSQQFYRALVFPSVNLGPHPADLNTDFRITSDEHIAYNAAYGLAQPWPISPSPIPAAFRDKATLILQSGETYHANPAMQPPDCWVPGQ